MALKTSRQKLLEAIEQCQLSRIINLVKQGHNIHVKNTFGQNFLVHILQQQQQTPLLSKKRFQIFQFLITNYNLDIHSFDYYGKNLFNWATNLNCTQEALYLINSYPGDIDILVRDHTGSCSLHYAVEHGNDILVHAIVNYLLRYRLRFDIKDAHNNTPEDLARKLGYEKIGHFLGEACRSTVFLSREIACQQQRPLTNKSKLTTTNTNSLMTSSWLVDSSEYFNLIETKVNAAKSLDDWKTVATLRAFKKNINKKPSNRICKCLHTFFYQIIL
jgi:ankyrin repeat protein